MAASEEERLLADIRGGQREACATLIQAHYPAVYRFLLHLTRDVAVAEDLTQETFAAVWEKLGSFAGRSSIATWIHRIAYTKFVDARRRARRRLQVQFLVCQETPVTAQTTPLDAAIVDDQTRRLYAVLPRLDPRDQALLVLHYLQGLSYRDMADVLDATANTLKWRVRTALSRLRALFAGEGTSHEHESIE